MITALWDRISGRDTARALKAAGAAHDLAAATTLKLTTTEMALDNARKALVLVRSERDASERLHRASVDELNSVWARIHAARALATPRMANIGWRFLRALDGEQVK